VTNYYVIAKLATDQSGLQRCKLSSSLINLQQKKHKDKRNDLKQIMVLGFVADISS